MFRATGPTGAVAVKILAPAVDVDAAARARFDREIAALGQLAHPNLVTLVDHGFDLELGPYLVLPLLAGTNLRALCGGRALCPETAMLLVQPVVAATAALHAAGYVHRDLKPENAIASPDGVITVIDLGLAWSDGMTHHTDTGTTVGSVGYMAPEQIEGRTVDAAADIWALGVILYEWIAGKRPFQRARPSEEAAAVLLATCSRLDAADRRCSAELADLVASCLALDPSKRPTAAALDAAITQLIDWTDDVVTERAAAVADPAGYQARVAPFRIRRLDRLACDALAAGKPFVALAYCDRGLAYAPDDPRMLELVAYAEAATARPGATAMPATGLPARSPRWKWIAIAIIGCLVGAAVAFVAMPGTAPDPWADRGTYTPPTAAEQDKAATERERDRELFRQTFSLFGHMVNALDKHDAVVELPDVPSGSPRTARAWLQRAARQAPSDAISSVRHALEIDPDWAEAQSALCKALVATQDRDTEAACKRACELGDATACGEH